MFRRRVVVLALFFACLHASAEDQSKVSGYVTKVDPSGAFDLEGVHVTLTPKTEFRVRSADNPLVSTSAAAKYFIGETVDVIGPLDRSARNIKAEQVIIVEAKPVKVGGIAIIDAIPQQPSVKGERVLRADGYMLHLNSSTKVNLDPAIHSLEEVTLNQWIEYSGVQQVDGTVLCSYAGIGLNHVAQREEKLLQKNAYDPAAVTDSDRQNAASRFFAGTDAKRIPPYKNPEMQARVERIGNKLIPAFQRALPETDPTKINFRFQVIDSTTWRDAVALPTGTIVIPRQVVERMQNDDQLAAVLADNIAGAFEKDALRIIPTVRATTAANYAATAADFFVPGIAAASWLAGKRATSTVHNQQQNQSGRVGLDLMHDAGYDITQAPIAWWLLGSAKPEPIDKIKMPSRAANLYMVLGTTWHTPDPAAGPSDASPSPNATH